MKRAERPDGAKKHKHDKACQNRRQAHQGVEYFYYGAFAFKFGGAEKNA